MFDWKGKKLLILGATAYLAEVAKTAKEHGAYVIVADFNERAPAKKIADEALQCDVMDVDAVVEYVKNNNVDGVITGFTDSLMKPYCEICDRTGLPCYLSSDSYRFTTDKEYFKKLCRQFDIPVIKEYSQDETINNFPVIVKPVDNSGARGIAVCRSVDEFASGVEYALTWSKSKRLLIEEYIESQEATVFYLFKDGEYYLSAMGDRHMTSVKDGFIKLPTGYTFPSVGLEKFSAQLDEKFKALFRYLGIRDGMMFIQGFISENNEFTPYECGYRLTGSLEYHILRELCGFDPMAMCINHALTGTMGDEELPKKINPVFSFPAYNISCLMKPGKIARIEGIDALRELSNVIYCFPSYGVGFELPDTAWGKLSQIFLRVLMFAKNTEQFKKTMAMLENVHVFDEHNNELLINKYILKDGQVQ